MKKQSKLKLGAMTVRVLSSDEAKRAVGGMTVTCTTCTVTGGACPSAGCPINSGYSCETLCNTTPNLSCPGSCAGNCTQWWC